MKKGKLGDCFQVAGNRIIESDIKHDKDMRLVHGTAWSEKLKQRIKHAWIEIANGKVVLDNSNGHRGIVLREKYYAMGKIKDVKKYTKKEALKNMLEKGTWGEWE